MSPIVPHHTPKTSRNLNFSVVPKLRLGMRPAKLCFASLINPPDYGFAPVGRFAKQSLA